MTRYFITPPYITLGGFNYLPSARTYTEYNYLKSGLGSPLKVRHFEYALQLTKEYFHKCNVIDFGCADGPFLPSLSKYFNHVMGVDKENVFVTMASNIAADFDNVDIADNSKLNMIELKSKLRYKYQVLFLLETLEHIGDKDNPWASRASFVEELFGLLDKDGVIVISVPNMVGIPFLIQRAGLFVFNAKRDKLSFSELLRATLFNDTTTLEQRWQEWHMSDTRHIGFNHLKLECHLKEKFTIVRKKNILFQVLYVIKKKNGVE